MTQDAQPNKKSDLTAPVVLKWLQSFNNGILSGLDVTPGGAAFQVTVASGIAVIGGSHVEDDETRLNNATLVSPGGGNEHWIIYAEYTYTDTFPPASMTFGSAVAPPPTLPTLPTNAVKLVDIFIPSGTPDINDAGVLFIRTPKLADRGKGDGDTLIDRLTNSNLNLLQAGGDTITYNGSDTFTWTDIIRITAPTITHKEKFFTAPLAVGEIAAGSIGPGVPAVGPNSILFTVFDRSTAVSPASPTALTMHVLDLDAPNQTERDIFFNEATRENIVFVAYIFSGVINLASGLGTPLPIPDADTLAYLQNDPGGSHTWEHITGSHITNVPDGVSVIATDVQGAIDELSAEKFSATQQSLFLADLASQVTPGASLVGMDAISAGAVLDGAVAGTLNTSIGDIYTDVDDELRGGTNDVDLIIPSGSLGGGTWGVAVPSVRNAQLALREHLQFGLGVDNASGGACLVTATGGLGLSIATGTFFTRRGSKVAVSVAISLTAPAGPGQFIVKYDPGANTFSASDTSLDEDEFPFAVINVSGGVASVIKDVRRQCTGSGWDKGTVTVGELASEGRGAMFNQLDSAVYYAAAFDFVADNEPVSFLINSNLHFDRIDGTESWLATRIPDRLDGCRIVGVPTATGFNQPEVTWDDDAPFIDFGPDGFWSNVIIENLNILKDGGTTPGDGAADPDFVMFKNPGPGLRVINCTLNGGGLLSHLVRWNGAFNFGGHLLTSRLYSTLFDRCNIFSLFPNKTVTTRKDSVFSIEADMGIDGLMVIRDSIVHSANAADYMVSIVDSNTLMSVYIENSRLRCAGDSIFSLHPIHSYDDPVKVVVTNCILEHPTNDSDIFPRISTSSTGKQVSMIGCQFRNNFRLDGVYTLIACEIANDAQIRGARNNIISGCEFMGPPGTNKGSFFGDFAAIGDSRIALEDVQLSGTVSITSGTKALTGVGTNFLSVLRDGDYISIDGVNNICQKIDSVDSDTGITLFSDHGTTESGVVIHRVGCLNPEDGADTGPRTVVGCTVQKFLNDGICRNLMAVSTDDLKIGFSEFSYDTSTGEGGDEMFRVIAPITLIGCRIGEDNAIVADRDLIWMRGSLSVSGTFLAGNSATLIGNTFTGTERNGSVMFDIGGVWIGNIFDLGGDGASGGELNWGSISSLVNVVIIGNQIAGGKNDALVDVSGTLAFTFIGNTVQNNFDVSSTGQRGVFIGGDAKKVLCIGNSCWHTTQIIVETFADIEVGISVNSGLNATDEAAVMVGNLGHQNGSGDAFDNDAANRYGGNASAGQFDQTNVWIQAIP